MPRNYSLSLGAGTHPRPPGNVVEANLWPEMELQRAADRIILARFGPPGLIVDERLNVLQSRGQTTPYLEISPGGVSWSLLRVLKEGVANEAREAIQRAMRENVPTSTVALLREEDKGEQKVQIDVLPITSAVSRPRCYLVLFQTIDAEQIKEFGAVAHNILTADEKDRLVAQLRQDLSSTRFHLESLIEERDARNQELVSANEEIQSANEELQSTNEELETTKEELQSANEELQTVNEELQQRNGVLMQTGNDLINLLNSVNIPLLMLTSDLHIRQFTPPMQRLLNLRPTDIGRSIKEIRLQLSLENIEPILHEVLETLGTREVEVQDRDSRWHLLRVRPYRTAENKIEGLVVLRLDIDQLRRSQQQLVDANHFASTVMQSVPVPVVIANRDLTVRTSNRAFRDLSEMSAKELEGRSLPDLLQHLWSMDGVRARLEQMLLLPDQSISFEHEWMTDRTRTMLVNVQVLTTEADRILLVMLEDITLRLESERQITKQKEALQSKVQLAERALTRTKEELSNLAAHLFTVQEEERERVARELHDDVSQRLSLIEIQLTQAQSGEKAQEALNSARKHLQTLNTDVRTLSHQLHPAILKDLGLPAALRALVEEFGAREEMPATFVAGELPESLPDEATTAIYRITQEALRNVAKHAGRTHVKVSLQLLAHELELKVMDFGIGFDQEAGMPGAGLGMISMQERAHIAGGRFKVHSALGSGTTIEVCIPLNSR